MSLQIYNPHDAIFKKFFSDIEVARTFVKSYLDPDLQQKCNLTSLKIEPGSFVEEELSQQHSDILYSLKIDGIKGYVYINVEHQSSPNKLMPFRMLRYKLAIMKQHLDQGHKKLPTVISILFYHGKKGPYPYSLSLIECFEDPDFARQHFLNDAILVDLSQISDETFEKHHKRVS
ncbi:Rpn family recombination-promoting nuclease/putative transposase [Rickettsiella massiliensis]|uniref:Rpn family recombination-promoting nuclease/putative transposase n=1 Tax=Rickettsiella massiliensis TaxID=676517 RepID=UPI00029B2E9A|nr:Rpn family recombination-promoting nuclease/putative transposase [Rickettsiella massiliensis]